MSEVSKPISRCRKILEVVRVSIFPVFLSACANSKLDSPESTDAPCVFVETEGSKLNTEEEKFNCYIQVSNGSKVDWTATYIKGKSEAECEAERIKAYREAMESDEVWEVRTVVKMSLSHLGIISGKDCTLKKDGRGVCLNTERFPNGWNCWSEQIEKGKIKEINDAPEWFCNPNSWEWSNYSPLSNP